MGDMDGTSTLTSGSLDHSDMMTGSGMSWRDRSMQSSSSTGSMTPTSDSGDTTCTTPHGELQEPEKEDKDKLRRVSSKAVAPKVMSRSVSTNRTLRCVKVFCLTI